jgi:hypothetical protein
LRLIYCWNFIYFFEHLNNLKWKKIKTRNCRSCRELQFSYKNHLHPRSYEKNTIFLRLDFKWAKFCLKPNFEFGIFRIKSRKIKNGRKMSKPFSLIFQIWCSVFRNNFEFIRKYEFDRVKCRKWCGSVRDISIPFFHPYFPLNISFRRALVGEKLKDCISLVALFLPVTLNDNKDEFIWLLNKNEKFSTQSLYRDIMKKEHLTGKNEFWKANLPLN